MASFKSLVKIIAPSFDGVRKMSSKFWRRAGVISKSGNCKRTSMYVLMTGEVIVG